MTTFGQRLSQFKGFGPGFDFARIFLAFSVLAWHTGWVATGSEATQQRPVLWVLFYSILPMFFGLSGFLIAGSAQRLSLKNFLVNRGLRILPALGVEIILSAAVLGPLLTVFTLAHYLSDKTLYMYFFNITGWVHYRLPGVFLNAPVPALVNGSLWTVPFEMFCYAIMSGLILSGWIKRGWVMVALAFGVVSIGVVYQMFGSHMPPNYLKQMLDMIFDRGALLIPCFLLGAAAYALRDRIVYDARIFFACVAAALALGYFGDWHLARYCALAFFTCPLYMYIMLFVGMSPMPKLPFFSTGDYSYGVYLYAFPIQQTVVSALHVTNIAGHLVSSAVAATLFATFSWHCIEKPILAARKNFSFVARKELNREAEPAGSPVTPPAPETSAARAEA
ncbi:MAG: acyltransferase [Roseiarcus sp.]